MKTYNRATHNIFKFIMNPTEDGMIPDKLLFLKSLYKNNNQNKQNKKKEKEKLELTNINDKLNKFMNSSGIFPHS